MIVYADRHRRVRTGVAPGNRRDTLIRFGEVEAAIADMLCPERDEPHPVLERLREVSLSLARGDLSALERMPPLPAEVRVSVPEGYAFYAVYPEDYTAAAQRFVREMQPKDAVVIGIRSIGASLGAAVAAALEETDIAVQSCTLRPRGHPFDRHLVLGTFPWNLNAYFLVVDEGPGLSGSSFAATARKLGELGVPDERIIFFPSWDADGSTFLSQDAREQWRRHRRYTVSRDPFPGWLDLSAGKWRNLCGASAAVYPQHERRKYLRDSILVKFEGLADYGKEKLERARELWDAGFVPHPLGLDDDGYLASVYVAAAPVERAAPDLLEWICRYLRFLQNHFPSNRPVPFEQNMEMIRLNVLEGLGPEWARRLDRLERFRSTLCDAPTVKIDGRMLPQEFLRTAGGYLKTDALDHHDDHFFPGCQDIAWDAAATCVEFGLAEFPDADIQPRLPFYLLAYLSYKLGYCTMAAQSGPDASKFQTDAAHYGDRLRYEIDRLC